MGGWPSAMVPEAFTSLLSTPALQSAPLAWLKELHSVIFFRFFIVFSAISLCLFAGTVALATAPGSVDWSSFPLYILYAVCTVGGLACQQLNLTPRAWEFGTVASLIIVAALNTYMLLWFNNAVYRRNCFLVQMMAWRQIPGLLGFRTVASFTFMACATAVDMHFLSLLAKYGDEVVLRHYANILIYGVGYMGLALLQQHRLRALHSAQSQLAVERDASQSLLSMVCDAAFWVAADGDTVLKSHQCLDTLVGKAIQGERLSLHAPAGERARLRQAFGDGIAAAAPVTLLPTSLLRSDEKTNTATTAAVDFFIVDRRLAFAPASSAARNGSSQSQTMGFLVGMRLNSEQQVLNRGTNEEEDKAVASLDDSAALASAMATTTAAERSTAALACCGFAAKPGSIGVEDDVQSTDAGSTVLEGDAQSTAASTVQSLACTEDGCGQDAVVVHPSSSVISVDEDGRVAVCLVSSLGSGSQVLCTKLGQSEPCFLTTLCVTPAPQQQFCEVLFGSVSEKAWTVTSHGCASPNSSAGAASADKIAHVFVPKRAQVLISNSVAEGARLCPAMRLGKDGGSNVPLFELRHGEGSATQLKERLCAAQLGGQSGLPLGDTAAGGLEVHLQDGRNHALFICVHAGAAARWGGHVVAVARPRTVRFGSREDDTSSTSSVSVQSTASRSILLKSEQPPLAVCAFAPVQSSKPPKQQFSSRTSQASAPCAHGPPLGPPFLPSGEYLEDCSLSCIDDLIASWNFETKGCCVWHSHLCRLSAMVERMHGWHECSEGWLPDSAAWQCENCLALQQPDRSPEFCWVCNEERALPAKKPRRSKRSSGLEIVS